MSRAPPEDGPDARPARQDRAAAGRVLDAWQATDGSWRVVLPDGRRFEVPSLEEAPSDPIRTWWPERAGGVVLRGDAGRDALAAALGPLLREEGEADPRHDIVIVALDRWDAQALGDHNQEALRNGQPWLPCGPFEGPRLHLGPLVVPGETACYRCLLDRRRANTEDLPGLEAEMQGRRKVAAEAWWPLVAAMAADEARRFQSGQAPRTLGTLLIFDTQTLTTRHDAVLRTPRCPACSRLRDMPPRAGGLGLTAAEQ